MQIKCTKKKAKESNIKAESRAGFSQKWQGLAQVVLAPPLP